MKKIKFMIIACGFAFVSYSLLYLLTGHIIFSLAYNRVAAKNDGKINEMIHNPPAIPGYEPVNHTSPDILYSYAPVRFDNDLYIMAAEVPDSSVSVYWSFSLFQENSLNYFASNDIDENGKRVRKYLLAGPNSPKNINVPGALRIDSPTNKNALILRYIAKSVDDIPQIDTHRKKIRFYKYNQSTAMN